MKVKVRFIVFLLITLLAALAGAVFAACSDDDTPSEHEHTVESWTVVTPSTCTVAGSESGTCTVCGETVTRPLALAEHSWNEGTVTLQPSCSAEGKREFTCNECGASKTETIEKSEHDWQTVKVNSSATCETAGERAVKCRVCGESGTVEIPARGHDWQWQGEAITEPTCTETGLRNRKCSRCGKSEQATLPALGHSWAKEYTVDKKPTFSEDGSRSIHCTRCDEGKNDVQSIPKLQENLPVIYELRLVRENGDLVTIGGIRCKAYSSDGGELGSGTFINGVAQLPLKPGEYTVSLENLPEGYSAQARYTINYDEFSPSGNPCNDISVSASLIDAPASADVKYRLGSVMHDFTVTDIRGNTLTLSELLQTKKMVLLNFWYIGCQFCEYEFPGMEAAYKLHSDDVAIIAINDAINHGSSPIAVSNFVNGYGLTFNVALDNEELNLVARFNISSFPATIVIDCNGVVSEIHNEALINRNDFEDLEYCTRQFEAIFEKYSNPPYFSRISAAQYALPAKRESL